MKDLSKRLVALMFVILFTLSTTISVNATNEAALPRGDSDIVRAEESLAEQFEFLLLNITSKESRDSTLYQAYQMGITVDDLENVTLSAEEILILSGEVEVQRVIPSDRAILTADSGNQPTTSANIPTNTKGVIVAGVEMPTYALWPKIYKQSTRTYCSAATVYTVGKYIGATPPSQATIMNFWKSQWGVTYPDLPLMRNYLNLHLPGKPSGYIKYVNKKYAGSQTTFNKSLKKNVINYQPMIILMKNSSGTANWPYETNGHFCLCNGLLTWENNKYFIGDPFYFSSYVPGATENNGEHKRTWTQLNNVITNRFGSGSQYCLTL